MRTQEPKTIHLKDYQAPEWLVDSTHLLFELGDDETIVTSTTAYRHHLDQSGASLALNGEELELLEVLVNGHVWSDEQYTASAETLVLHGLPDACEIAIKTRIYPQKNTSLEGLYQSSGNFCTQCEAQGFRKITYFQDRPDVMTTYTTRIEAEKAKYPVLLSNGNLIESGDSDDGKHFAVWQDPHHKPCYLFALVAGDLECVDDQFVTQSGREVVLKIYMEAHNKTYCDHAMASLKRAMQWDEERFGLEYDLDIYMIVAVDDFNMGAMENKGLNVFNSRLVFASPETATDKQYIDIEAVIGHEYFHNWTGNRVTCRDWFQLSLKEGLTVFRDQEFTADLHSRPVKRIEDVRMLRSLQFEEDGGPMAHPIRPASYIEINNFYTLTVYEKGAEVVRLYHTLLGQEGFRKGIDLYFERHDGQAVTTEDFLAAMADANNTDLSALQTWYDQAGTPEVQVDMDYDQDTQQCTLIVKQSCPPTPESDQKQPYWIPLQLGLIGQDGELPLYLATDKQSGTGSAINEGESSMLLHVTKPEHTFTFTGVAEKPVPSLLRGFSAPVKLSYAYTDDDLIFLMSKDSDAFNRWEAAQQLAMSTLLGLVDAHKKGNGYGLSHAFIQAFQDVLTDESLDCALRAEALSLPGYSDVAERLGNNVDPQIVIEVVNFMHETLANSLRVNLEQTYDALNVGVYSLDGESMAKRQLKNVCLAYLGQVDDELLHDKIYQQFISADNMTDSLSAFRVLVDVDTPLSDQVIEEFHDKWKDNNQVMDLWFTVQAAARKSNTLDNVNTLLEHPLFTLKNPNKVRALIGAFSRNYYCFHQDNGKGYEFLATMISRLDSMNPQIASRLVKPLIGWKSLEPVRSNLMKQQLDALMQKKGLSKDVFEIVSKGLA